MWVSTLLLLACLCLIRGELRRRLSIKNLQLDATQGFYLGGDTATATFSVSDETESNVFCIWYDGAGEPVDGCDGPQKKLTAYAPHKYRSTCKLTSTNFGQSSVECQSIDTSNNKAIEHKEFDVLMSTTGGIYTESDDKGPPETDDKSVPDPSSDDPGKGPKPQDDDAPAPAPGPTNHHFDDDYAVTYAPTEKVQPGPGPQPAPSPDPGPMSFDDDGGPAPIPKPAPGPDGPVIEDDVAPHPGPVPGPLDPKDADDDDWHPPTEGPTSEISVTLTVSMTISGVSKASWDKDTSSYNSAWALAMVRTITSYYITQSNIVNIGVKAGDSSDGTDRVVVTGTVKANDPTDTADSVYSRVEDAVGNGIFTYLLDEEARLINAWDLQASKAESIKRVTTSASVSSVEETFDEAEAAAKAEKAQDEMDEAEAAAEADKLEDAAEKAQQNINDAEAAAEADKAAAGGSSDSSPEEDGTTAPGKDTGTSSQSSSSKASENELGAGAIIGIVAGCVAAIVLAGLSYKMMCRARKQEPSVTAMGITPPSHVPVTVENPMV